MSKPMTISEAVDILRDEAIYACNFNGSTGRKITRQALATLEGVRLCDEVEAREMLMDLIRQHAKIASDPNYLGVFQLAQVHGMPYTGPQFDLSAARRWLAEHGGE